MKRRGNEVHGKGKKGREERGWFERRAFDWRTKGTKPTPQVALGLQECAILILAYHRRWYYLHVVDGRGEIGGKAGVVGGCLSNALLL